jgi:hypothetical protein
MGPGDGVTGPKVQSQKFCQSQNKNDYIAFFGNSNFQPKYGAFLM